MIGIARCCACTVSGEAATDPATAFMKSRRRIAFTKAGTTPIRTRLQQGFAAGEIGFRSQVARQQSWTANVRFGSKADIEARPRNVRFTPESGHPERRRH